MTKQEVKAKFEIEKKFYDLMFELGIINKFNKFPMINLTRKTEYGWSGYISLEIGLSFADISKNIAIISENLKCIWIMQTEQFSDKAQIQIVTEKMDKNFPYECPKLKPNEMYQGIDFLKKPIIIDVNKYNMFLLAGATGSGKTRFIYQILLSWILSCQINEVEIYLSDIAKNEYNCLQYCKHVKYYASELEELYKLMFYIKHKIKMRKQTIAVMRDKGLATNIEEYNQISKQKMSYSFLIIDEASVIMPDKTDSENEKLMKQVILDVLKDISKTGRGLGIFCFIATQKTVKDELPSVIKNMSAVRISFRANDMVSSEVIMGDHSAVGLADRYAVYSLNGGSQQKYLYSPKITIEKIKELIKPFEDRKHLKVDINAYLPQKNDEKYPPKQTHMSEKSLMNKKKTTSITSDFYDSRKVSGDFIDY